MSIISKSITPVLFPNVNLGLCNCVFRDRSPRIVATVQVKRIETYSKVAWSNCFYKLTYSNVKCFLGNENSTGSSSR